LVAICDQISLARPVLITMPEVFMLNFPPGIKTI
jgi:hypothetical protein